MAGQSADLATPVDRSPLEPTTHRNGLGSLRPTQRRDTPFIFHTARDSGWWFTIAVNGPSCVPRTRYEVGGHLKPRKSGLPSPSLFSELFLIIVQRRVLQAFGGRREGTDARIAAAAARPVELAGMML